MKLRLIISLLFNLIISTFLLSQKEVTVEGESQSEIYDNETKIDALNRIKQAALINALEKAFGIAIFQGNSMYLNNIQTGNKTETVTGFNTIADTYVKGEVVEELDVKWKDIPFEKKKGNKTEKAIEYKCTVKIKAREYIEPKSEFTAYTLNCTDTSTCKTTIFKNNEDFYLYFKSPKTGFLTVFLDDNQSSSILLPYSTNRHNFIQNGYPVDKNKEYIFFKSDLKYYDPKITNVDELSWETRENMEKLTIIFSSEPFELPDLHNVKTKELPQNLPSVDFNKWLIDLRKSSKSVEIMKIPLSTFQK